MSKAMLLLGFSESWPFALHNGKSICCCMLADGKSLIDKHGINVWDRKKSESSGSSPLFHSRISTPVYGDVDPSGFDTLGRAAKNNWQLGSYGPTKYLCSGDSGWSSDSIWGSSGICILDALIYGYKFNSSSMKGRYGEIQCVRLGNFRIDGTNAKYDKSSFIYYPKTNDEFYRYWPKFRSGVPSIGIHQVISLSDFALNGTVVNPIGNAKFCVIAKTSYVEGLPVFTFKHDEYSTYKAMTELGVWKDRRFEAGCSAAYMNAVDTLPEAQCNTLANILDIISGLKSFGKGYKSIRGASNLAKEAWLGYRYAFNTTISDVRAYSDLALRLLDLQDLLLMTCYGYYQDDLGRYTCTAMFLADDVLPPGLRSKIERFGLKLDAVNLWDMVPYSFVADWFFHIGDILADLETWNKGIKLQPINMWFTINTNYLTPSGIQDTFIRIRGTVPPHEVGFRYKSTSKRTLFMRVMDAWALFVG